MLQLLEMCLDSTQSLADPDLVNVLAQVTNYTPGLVNVAVACFLFGLLALMHISQELFERQRSNLTLLMRVVRWGPAQFQHLHSLLCFQSTMAQCFARLVRIVLLSCEHNALGVILHYGECSETLALSKWTFMYLR